MCDGKTKALPRPSGSQAHFKGQGFAGPHQGLGPGHLLNSPGGIPLRRAKAGFGNLVPIGAFFPEFQGSPFPIWKEPGSPLGNPAALGKGNSFQPGVPLFKFPRKTIGGENGGHFPNKGNPN